MCLFANRSVCDWETHSLFKSFTNLPWIPLFLQCCDMCQASHSARGVWDARVLSGPCWMHTQTCTHAQLQADNSVGVVQGPQWCPCAIGLFRQDPELRLTEDLFFLTLCPRAHYCSQNVQEHGVISAFCPKSCHCALAVKITLFTP